jgi:hypothetical protein
MKTHRGTPRTECRARLTGSSESLKAYLQKIASRWKAPQRRRRCVVDRESELAGDHMLEILSTLEVPALNKLPELLILLELQ